jgi:2,4-diaminopentanoate dehydrogenase
VAVRVIQWATGAIGSECLKLILDRAALKLVGLRAYSEHKIGADAGPIVARAPCGVLGSGTNEEILHLEADVVIYTPTLDPNADHDAEIIALLESGKNVISARGHIWPPGLGAAHAARIQSACQKGNSTLYGGGLNPGFINDRIGPALTSACSDVRSVAFISNFDLRKRTHHAIFDVCLIGRDLSEINADAPAARMLEKVYTEGFHLIAEHFGTRIASIRREHTPAPATRDLEIKGGRVAKGSVGGVVWRWVLTLENGPEVSFEFRWFVDPDMPGWGDPRDVRMVKIDGDPPIYAEFIIGDAPEHVEPYESTARTMAALLVNAIPDIVAAPAGIFKTPIFAPWRVG